VAGTHGDSAISLEVDADTFTHGLSDTLQLSHDAALGEFGCLDCFTRFNLGDFRAGLIFGALHVVIRLQVQPELMRRAEKTRETSGMPLKAYCVFMP